MPSSPPLCKGRFRLLPSLERLSRARRNTCCPKEAGPGAPGRQPGGSAWAVLGVGPRVPSPRQPEGGSSQHPWAARVRRPRLTPGDEESRKTPWEPPKFDRKESGGHSAHGEVGFLGGSTRGPAVTRPPAEPGAPRQRSFPAHPPTDRETRGFRAAGRRSRPGAWACYARVCVPAAPFAARHGNLKQRRCLQQKPDCRTPGARRSQSQRRTLMYRCPISAFNWCPLGQATRERGAASAPPASPACSQGNK